MEQMEKIAWRIWKQETMGKALLIGGLLFYVPFLNLLLVGYYARWLKRLTLREGMELPAWGNGRALLEEFLRAILPVLVWGVLPFWLAVLLGWGIAGLLSFMHLSLFGFTVA